MQNNFQFAKIKSVFALPHGMGQRGIVLVTVIFLVALMAILLVGIFGVSGKEFRSAKAFADGIKVDQVANVATGMAIGQIRQATTHPNSPNNSVSWVSQPGAIRTFAQSSVDSDDQKVGSKLFKLYTSSNMVMDLAEGNAIEVLKSEFESLREWETGESMVGAYVDMNEPLWRKVEGESEGEWVFPIADPRGRDENKIEGFDFESGSVEGVGKERLPMPVRWMYVLEDGTTGTMIDGQFSGPKPATAANPIVARYAFWVDDESGKINVNTASEAIPWDTPRCVNEGDVSYARERPVYNEFQRYPGHPATTCLSSVFFPGQRASAIGLGDLNKTQLRKIYDITPRVSSEGGGYFNKSNRRVEIDEDRLYATFDEVLFSANRSEHDAFTGMNRDNLERGRFFLTAQSKAPETNVFGRPRVCLWPIDGVSDPPKSRTPKRTPFDQLIAFCTTIGDRYEDSSGITAGAGAYHFFRGYDRWTNGEWEPAIQALEWIFYGRGMPSGHGVGTHRLNHNYWLYHYLVDQTKQVLPKYEGSLREKYGPITYGHKSKSQHMTAVSDYFCFLAAERSYSTNLFDTTLIGGTTRVHPFAQSNFRDHYGIGYLSQFTWMEEYAGGGLGSVQYVQGSTFYDVKGPFGGIARNFSLSEMAMTVVNVAENKDGKISGDTKLAEHMKLAPGEKIVQMAFLPEAFVPAQGYSMMWCQSMLHLERITGSIRGRLVDPATHFEIPMGTLFRRAFYGGNEPPNLNEFGMGRGTTTIGEGDNFAATSAHPNDINPQANLWGGTAGIDFFSYQGNGPFRYAHQRGIYSRPFVVAGDALQASEVKMYLELMEPFGVFDNEKREYEDYPSSGAVQGRNRNGNLSQPVSQYMNYPRRPLQSFTFTFPKVNAGFPMPEVDEEMAKRVGGFRWEDRLKFNAIRAQGTMRGAGPIVFGENDVVRSLVPSHSDYRLVAATMHVGREFKGKFVPTNGPAWFVPHPEYFGSRKLAHSLQFSGGDPRGLPNSQQQSFPPGVGATGAPALPDFPTSPGMKWGGDYRFDMHVPTSYPYSVNPTETRDWDNGTGISPDGAYVNKPDDGAKTSNGGAPPYFAPYVKDFEGESGLDESFAPNRVLSSAVSLGSLPYLAPASIPWTTPLFRPDITRGGHIGAVGNGMSGKGKHPPDHMWLDLFWMPVVQPYAISQPFATSGKINMNYQLFPFAHIKRATGMHAVLKSEEILAIPNSAKSTYKSWSGAGNPNMRRAIDAKETLKQFEDKFLKGEVFMTESEICEQFLVPDGETLENMEQFWSQHALTGDNSLERPYDRLYPRLCTRSNIFRIHVRAQTLKKARTSDPATFDEDKDLVLGEYRGDSVIERYIDPNDKSIPDYVDRVRRSQPSKRLNSPAAITSREPSLDKFYQFRILSTRRFSL